MCSIIGTTPGVINVPKGAVFICYICYILHWSILVLCKVSTLFLNQLQVCVCVCGCVGGCVCGCGCVCVCVGEGVSLVEGVVDE